MPERLTNFTDRVCLELLSNFNSIRTLKLSFQMIFIGLLLERSMVTTYHCNLVANVLVLCRHSNEMMLSVVCPQNPSNTVMAGCVGASFKYFSFLTQKVQRFFKCTSWWCQHLTNDFHYAKCPTLTEMS